MTVTTRDSIGEERDRGIKREDGGEKEREKSNMVLKHRLNISIRRGIDN